MDVNEAYRDAKEGDNTAEEQLCVQLLVSFRVIVQRRIWNRADSEDIVQMALITILDKYKTTEIRSSFAAWAHKVLTNKMLDYVKLKQIRARKMDEFVGQRGLLHVPPPDPNLKARIRGCFARINRSHKQYARILNLRFQGYSAEEICKTLKITRNNLYVSLSRARAMLRACLDREETDS